MMKKKFIKCARRNISLPQETYKKFKKYCEDNSLKFSTKIAELIKKFMEKQK